MIKRRKKILSLFHLSFYLFHKPNKDQLNLAFSFSFLYSFFSPIKVSLQASLSTSRLFTCNLELRHLALFTTRPHPWEFFPFQKEKEKQQEYSIFFGLRANMEKSALYMTRTTTHFKEQILTEMQFIQGELPFKYLGVPLSTERSLYNSVCHWWEKMEARIRCWSTKLLSYSGRVQLIKSILFEMQTYWAQIFLLPKRSN